MLVMLPLWHYMWHLHYSSALLVKFVPISKIKKLNEYNCMFSKCKEIIKQEHIFNATKLLENILHHFSFSNKF